ncbi:hypothetical protein QLF84_25095, partial [Salmonella enterica subsp. enterica serovar Oslo]|uniref:hypothetical protein n=1 Tax=Salmonella enterica TaxID=28901 RepID=UPI002891504A
YETEKWNPHEVIVRLHGERARGRFVLVRTKDDWLLRRSDPVADDHEPLPREARLATAEPGPRPAGPGWTLQVGFGGRRVLVRVEGGRAEVTDADGDPLDT